MSRISTRCRILKDGNMSVSVRFYGRGSITKVTEWLSSYVPGFGTGAEHIGIWKVRQHSNNTLTFYTKPRSSYQLRKLQHSLLEAYIDPH